MNIRFVVTHLSYGSPASFYRPYEMAKYLTNIGAESKILTPFEEDARNISGVPMIKMQNITQKLGASSFAYNSLRKIIYSKTLSRLISYDKLLNSLAEKTAKNIEKSLDVLNSSINIALEKRFAATKTDPQTI